MSKTDLLPLSPDADYQAKTLTGRAFNSLHDLLSNPELLSAKEREDRAKHSDQLAVVAADTIAMLPGMRLAGAGLLRASALLQTTGSWTDLGNNFLKDFSEGAALQKVSSTLLPGGVIGEKISAKLGSGLLGESASFAAAGAGIAAVTTSFRSETWFDQSGQFSAMEGGKNVLAGSLIASAFSVPAGILGSRIAKAGMSLANEGRISASSGFAIAGLGSGYLSGFAVGAAQGAASGGDLKTVFSHANEGGLTGALSGSIGLFAMARLQIKSNVFHEMPESNKTEARVAAKDSLEKGPVVAKERVQVQKDLELWRSLEISADKINDSEASLADRVRKLGTPGLSIMRYHVGGQNADEAAAMSMTFKDFEKNGGMRLVEDQVRVYAPGGGMTMSIPESYARRLDEVLQLRLKAGESTNIYTHGPEHVKEVYRAQEALAVHPLKDKAHPADFVHLLDELPDRTIVKDVFIREDRSPSDAWNAKTSKGFKAAATAGEEDQRITFYAQDRSPLLREYMKHEWSHLLKWRAANESTRFDQVAALERDGFYVSEYSRKNHDENWAEHAASLLHPDPDKFFDTAHGAPLRTVEIGRALMKSLAAVPRYHAGTHQAEIARRLAYIDSNVLPQAQAKLVDLMKSGQKQEALSAAALLYKIAGKSEFELLSETARINPDPEMREASFLSAWAKVLQNRTQNAGYDKEVHNPAASEMRDFLLSQAQPGSRSREMALEFLSKLRDNHSRFYHQLLTIDSFAGNKLSRSLDLMDRAPDTAALKLAFNEAKKFLDGKPDERVNLALRALDRHPALIHEAVDILARSDMPRVRPFLSDLRSHYDARVSKRAIEGLQRLDLDAHLSTQSKRLQSSDSAERVAAANVLAATKSPRAAALLADAYLLAASDADRSAISKAARDHISPAIWKFELRRKKQEQPQFTALLNNAMR